MVRSLLWMALSACLFACASAPTVVASPPVATPAAQPATPVSTYVDKSLKVDRLIIGGQPQVFDLQSLKNAGVTRVINLRTAEEMKTVDYDELAALDGQGLTYRNLPLGGPEFPYSPALLEAFAQEMQDSDGKILLHCASGGRAGMLYAAWLVKYRGQTPDQAMRTLEPLGGWPLPLEKLLGKPLVVEFASP